MRVKSVGTESNEVVLGMVRPMGVWGAGRRAGPALPTAGPGWRPPAPPAGGGWGSGGGEPEAGEAVRFPGGLERLLPRLAGALVERGLTVATAEADTCGLLGYLLGWVPGASRYFVGGVIAYSNRVKVGVLGVSEDLLARHGAVSAEVALAMARGARTLLGADLALSVTGIAGPTGGTPAKPVGLFYLGLSARDGAEAVRQHLLPGDRDARKWASAQQALVLLAEHLGLPPA